VTHQIGTHGLYAVFGLMILAAIIPVGSELVMLYAGALAGGAFAGTSLHVFGTTVHSHPWGFVWVVFAGTLGNVLGGAIGWAIGERGGRPLVERYVPEAKLARAERWFDRFGAWAVPIGLATPLVRSFVAIPAGIVRVPLRQFVVLALFGSAVFCVGLGGAGWALGSAYTHAHRDIRYVEYAVVAGVVLFAAYLGFRFFKAGRVNRRRADDPAR